MSRFVNDDQRSGFDEIRPSQNFHRIEFNSRNRYAANQQIFCTPYSYSASVSVRRLTLEHLGYSQRIRPAMQPRGQPVLIARCEAIISVSTRSASRLASSANRLEATRVR